MDTLQSELKKNLPELTVEKIRAERAKPEDFSRANILLLGSGTWNVGGAEGQLNPHMQECLKTAKDVDLNAKPTALLSLGDDRYHFTARATEHLQRFLVDHKGKLLLPPLVVVGEPYDQTERIERWGEKFTESIRSQKEWATWLSK